MTRVEDTDVMLNMNNHRFGNNNDDQPTLFAVKKPFRLSSRKKKELPIFNLTFDVIEDDLPFHLCLSSLLTMSTTISQKRFTIAFHLSGEYKRF